MPMQQLLSPTPLGPYTLANRVVMAPMTRSRAGAGNAPQAFTATYYAQRANAGLIITEATQVTPEGQPYIATPGIHSNEQIAAWKQVTDAVHAAGGRIFLQLWHGGRISHPDIQPNGQLPVAPSAIRAQGQVYTMNGLQELVTPRALETAEIADVVEQYRHGAANALAAGFDGVEVHAANGYLIDQFLRDGSNQRHDQYGGTVENRARFLFEVLDAVVAEWGAERVGVRLSPVVGFNDMRDSAPQALFEYVATNLNRYGLAYLHVIDTPSDDPTQAFDFAALRARYQGTYIVAGGYSRETAEAAIDRGYASLVAFGKPFISNPDLVDRFRHQAPLADWDPSSFYGGGAQGYIDYPTLQGEPA